MECSGGWHFSQMIYLWLFSSNSLTTRVFLSNSKCLPWLRFSFAITSIQLSGPPTHKTLHLSLHKGSYVRLCVSLVSPSHCFTIPPTFSPLLLQTAIMCVGAAENNAGLGALAKPPVIYSKRAEDRGDTLSCDACRGRQVWRTPCQTFSTSLVI